MGPRLRERLRGLSWADRLVFAATGLLFFGSLAAEPAGRWLDPRLDASVRLWVELAPTDRWGAPWKEAWELEPRSDGAHQPFSAGPNGVPEGGRGDDVVCYARDDWRVLLAAVVSEVLFIVAVLLAGGWEALRWIDRWLLGPPRPLGVEVALSLALSAPVALLAYATLAGSALRRTAGLEDVWDRLEDGLFVPLPVAGAGAVGACVAAGVLWVRLRRRGEDA